MNIVKGNILNATENIIGHQVNCMGVMGAGLARQIKNTYPKAFEEYKKFIADHKKMFRSGAVNDEHPIGKAQLVQIDENRTVANLFGQIHYGTDKKQTDYEALWNALEIIRYEVGEGSSEHYGKSIALPYGIGCGLAGGDWDVVYGIIKEIFGDYGVTLYKFV